MYHSLVIQKLIQKHFKDQPEHIFERFKNGDAEYEKKVRDKLKEEYKNIEFCFDTGQTPDDIERTIKHTREKNNKDVRLVVIDYNELVLTNFSDPTQSSAFAIQKMREIASKYNCCVIVLLQPNKLAGSPSDELKSYRSAKGSSAIEQAMSVMLGISRPGYNPRKPEEDKFLVINGLKNRMGSLFNVELSWDGLTGNVRELTDEERRLLKEIEERKNAEKEGKSDDW
jgi:replicative DNA helicase